MVKGLLRWKPLGPVVHLQKSLTGQQYVRILSIQVQPFLPCSENDE